MMLHRRSTQLAMQATLLLALEPEGTVLGVREIAAALGVPATYLSKVLQELTRVRLLRTVRGPGGGVQLARSARDIYLWDIRSAIEPVGELEGCFLGLSQCSDVYHCPLHEAWAPLRAQILNLLQSKTLWEFAAKARSKGVLSWEPRRSNGSRASSSGKEKQKRRP
jgi:Rrf2 family protein